MEDKSHQSGGTQESQTVRPRISLLELGEAEAALQGKTMGLQSLGAVTQGEEEADQTEP